MGIIQTKSSQPAFQQVTVLPATAKQLQQRRMRGERCTRAPGEGVWGRGTVRERAGGRRDTAFLEALIWPPKKSRPTAQGGGIPPEGSGCCQASPGAGLPEDSSPPTRPLPRAWQISGLNVSEQPTVSYFGESPNQVS